MKKHLSGLFAVLLLVLVPFSTSINAEELQLRDPVPATYTVVKGDTLWDISGTFLKNPWMWPEIWHVNAQIKNPHLIYPGDVIRLIYVDGKPRLTLDTSGRVFKLSPKARILSQEEAIDTIPLEAINAFLSRSRITTDEELAGSPYVLTGMDEHLIVGSGDRLYARGEFAEGSRVYGVYRRGEVFVDPETGENLGLLAEDLGTAEVQTSNGDVTTLAVTRASEDIRTGDRLMRQEERAIDSTFYPAAPSEDITGVILSVEKGLRQVGNMDVVVINRGEREGLAPGNVMAIYKRGATIRDRVSNERVTLPDERAGVLMVFRSFEKVSLALVLEAERGISVGDYIRNP